MTTREEAIEMAREAGFVLSDNATDEAMDRFIHLIDLAKQQENEACADICANLANCEENTDGYRGGASWCYEAIRARMKP